MPSALNPAGMVGPLPPPRSVLFLRPDGMGDLILFQPVLHALQAAWPQAKFAIVVRTSYCDLGSLMFPAMSWVGTAIDPFRVSPSAAGEDLAALRSAVESLGPDLVIACTEQRNWLDAAVSGMVPGARKVAFAQSGEDAYFGPQLRALYPEVPAEPFPEFAPVATGETAWRRNWALVTFLTANPASPEPPKLVLPNGAAEHALALLKEWGLAAGEFVVCAAAGFANVPIKTWPARHFVTVLQDLRAERGLGAVLVGSADERDYLASIASACGAPVWISAPTDWAALCAVLGASRALLGNDTGLLHLGAALGRPVVGIYGGGTWPRFIPAGAGAAVVNPLPCFGCGWDCPFGNAPCVGVIAPLEVTRALSHVLEAELRDDCSVVETHHLLPETAALMGEASRHYRERGATLGLRERQFQETVRLAAMKDGEIDALKHAADEKDEEIDALKRATDEKDAEIDALKSATDEKDVEIDALKHATNEKDDEIGALKLATDQKDREIASLKITADLRGRAAAASDLEATNVRLEADRRAVQLEKVHAAAADLRRVCEERLAVITAQTAELQRLRTGGGNA